jgi:hypothetical protein
MNTVTQWFSWCQWPSMQKPGYYEVRNDGTLSNRSGRFMVGPRRRYWDGSFWLTEKDGYLSVMGTHQSHQWRGLAVKPKTKP